MTAILSAGLLAYSQTWALEGDEGFHLLAAQLINAGKRPYIDFFYQHTPLYAYLSAGWMRVFGDNWRSAHLLSAFLSAACIMLAAEFAFTRLHGNWRLAGGITAGFLVGLHTTVIRFGTIAQPYALCLFLSVVAFRFVIRAVHHERGFLPFGAGLSAGAAAASSLLSALVAPILLVWMFLSNRSGNAVHKCIWFLAGAAIPFAPLLLLFERAPRSVFFDIVTYHLFYRRLNLPYAAGRDIKVLVNWLASSQGLLLVIPAAAGLILAVARRTETPGRAAEFYLCACLTVGPGFYLTAARPTFFEYFILLVPFLSILAAHGICAISSTVCPGARPGWLALLFAGLFVVAPARWAHQNRIGSQFGWRHYEEVAQEVNRVTPTSGMMYANEAVYFVSRRLPPPGLENIFGQYLPVTSGQAASLHTVPIAQIDKRLAAGEFATVVIQSSDPRVESLGLLRLYAQRKEIQGFLVLWDRPASQ